MPMRVFRTSLRPTLWAFVAILAYGAVQASCQWVCCGHGARFSTYGLNKAVAEISIMIGGLLLRLLSLRRIGLFAKALTAIRMIIAAGRAGPGSRKSGVSGWRGCRRCRKGRRLAG